MKKYKHIFFDLDGTLWDLHKNTHEAIQMLFREFDLNEGYFKDFHKRYLFHNEQVWALYREGKIEKEVLRTVRFERAFVDCGIQVNNEFVEDFAMRFIDVCPKLPHLLEGAIELLELWSKSAQLHIITNGFKEVQGFKLEAGKLNSYFHQIINSEDAGYRKPNPQIFQFAINRAGAQKQESLMIGDDWEADIIGARNFGMDQVFIRATENMQKKLLGTDVEFRHNYKPTLIIDSLLEIIPLLK